MSSEFELIRKYFVEPQSVNRAEVVLGSGDDCAILEIPQGYQLAISTDTLVSGVHFLENWEPQAIGHKILAVNLSDLAAMGAKPLAVSVAATFPKSIADTWVKGLADGFFALAHAHELPLIGGDLTAGPLSFTLNIYGLLPKGQAIKRSGAQVGDWICVSGDLGDAAAALQHDVPYLEQKLRYPEPRIKLGQQLLGQASSGLDISDGLAQDLSHILKASGVGAILELDKLPISDVLLKTVGRECAQQFALESGDAYELCFTISPEKFQSLAMPDCSVIGEVVSEPGLFQNTNQGLSEIQVKGFQHF